MHSFGVHAYLTLIIMYYSFHANNSGTTFSYPELA